MRLTFLLTILLLSPLIVVAACGGGDSGQEEPLLIEDAEAIGLKIGDVPTDFIEVEGSAVHITNSESCAGAQGAERDECLGRLEEWGRIDGYEVTYVATDPEAFLSGIYRIFGAVSMYRDEKGAAEAFRVGKERLLEELQQLDDAAAVEIPTVGEESVAFVTTDSLEIGERDIPISLHVVDFRRGNVLVRVGVDAPTVLASVEDALKRAEILDKRILRVAGRVASTATPTASP